MRWSAAFIPTLREAPKDAEAISHTLMLRAGLIRRLGSGAYSYLPLGVRVLHRVTAIIRDEMNRAGAQECLLPSLQPLELWKKTGRDAVLGEVLIRFKDRTGKEVALGPTHEEVVTDLVTEIKSHRQLPFILYQIQTKFRDEPRPRFGVIRSKEFIMKDAYSFDVNEEGLSRTYQRMYEAYQRIFARCGLSALPCEADSGAMGGNVSHEFMAPAQSGEDVVVRCAACGYAANVEAAECRQSAISNQQSAEQPKPLEEVATPGKHTVEQVSAFLKVPATQLLKTMLYDVGDGEHVAVLIRGDHEVNETKLAGLLKTTKLKLSNAQTIERLSGGPMGFTGPVRLNGVKLLVDQDVVAMVNAVTGANKADAHAINVNPGRDFTPTVVADLRYITAQDGCPRCPTLRVGTTGGYHGKALERLSAIEVGHVFKLGTKYSQALGAVVQDASGTVAPMIMGCYGIGVNRILASAIEQHHDKDGIIWPPAIAPFDLVLSILEADNPALLQLGAELDQELSGAGYAVLLDDRVQSPGSKLKDADLIGIPLQVIVGKTWVQSTRLEVVERASKTRHQVEHSQLLATVKTLLDKLAPRL